jgi:hypothetical protein
VLSTLHAVLVTYGGPGHGTGDVCLSRGIQSATRYGGLRFTSQLVSYIEWFLISSGRLDCAARSGQRVLVRCARSWSRMSLQGPMGRRFRRMGLHCLGHTAHPRAVQPYTAAATGYGGRYGGLIFSGGLDCAARSRQRVLVRCARSWSRMSLRAVLVTYVAARGPGHVCLCARSWSRMSLRAVLVTYVAARGPGHVCRCARSWSRMSLRAVLVTYVAARGPGHVCLCRGRWGMLYCTL